MAPRGVSTWRRPYTSIYNDNYRYGTGLYSDTLSDIEKKYSESISKAKLRSDRPDLNLTTFSGSTLTSSPAPAGDSIRENTGFSRQLSSPPVRELVRSPNFENRLNETLKSAAYELDEDVQDVINSRIEKRRQKALAAMSESENRMKSIASEESKNLSDDISSKIEKRMQKALAKSEAESKAKSYASEESKSLYDDISSRIEKRVQNALASSESESKAKSTANEESKSLYDDISSRIERRSQKALAKNESESNVKRNASTDESRSLYDDISSRIERRSQKALAKSESERKVKKSASTDESKSLYDDISSRIEKRAQKALAKSESEIRVKKSASADESMRPTSLYDDASFWSSSKTSDKLAELDLDIPKPRKKAGGRITPTNGPNSSQSRDKSRDLQDQVDSLEKSMSNVGNKLRNELSSLKSKYHTELSDLSSSVETTSQQANDLQKVCRRQASQIQELQSAYDAAQRNIEDALEEMSVWQNKCKSLKKEMDRLREEMGQAVHKSSKA